MATHKAFPNEILRCRSRMTRLEMLTTNYNLSVYSGYRLPLKMQGKLSESAILTEGIFR